MKTAYGVFPYDLNHFCAYLSYQTDTSFSYVRQKKQIIYIDNYLNKLAEINKSKICFIYENEYIDKNYIDDFSSYYVNCFASYKKTTSRIHFFKYKEDKDLKKEFDFALNSENSIFSNQNYLGFIIIRPIPKTFLAKVCLSPFYLKDRSSKYFITKQYHISLFGISLSIETIAFQEQDKVLSACATTSLWAFYHAHKSLCHDTILSSSEITKSAYSEERGYSREFPNNGLSTEMISRSLRKQNLSPEYFEFKEDTKTRLQELIYAYCSNGIPMILGVLVKDEEGISKGLHAITILGYSIKPTTTNLISQGLEKIYAHDDRYGPYLKMKLKDKSLEIELNGNKKLNAVSKKEIYEVNTLILGLYHKIRIPYIPIKNTCFALSDNIKYFIKSRENTKKNELEQFCKMIDDIKWDIAITENSILKGELLKVNIKDKKRHLSNSLPKYIWNAKAKIGDEILFQLLFDATDIEQGDVFVEYISYDEISDVIYEVLKQYAKEKIEEDINTDRFDINEEDDNYINGLLKYLNKEENYKESLDDLFGYLKMPLLIKPEEIENNIINSSKLFRENLKNSDNFMLDVKQGDYIWLIDKEGFLCIGVENNGNGHPTLTQGKPARIGGELKAVIQKNNKIVWKINSKSGRYSKEYTKEKQELFLTNSLLFKFKVIFPNEEFEIEV